MNFDLTRAILSLLVFIPAVGLHEYCHAKFADMAGDLTPRSQGRVTLNPLAHLDPMGTIMMLLASATGFGIGWGKPVQVNVSKMKNPRVDHFISVIAGPLSNLFQAVFYAIILRAGLVKIEPETLYNTALATSSLQNLVSFFVLASVITNVSMFFFNMIPLGPLDGHWLVGAFLSPINRNAWYKFCHGPGMLLFFLLVLIPAGSQFDLLGIYMEKTVFPVMRFLVGR
jgi:Zn-dependent protease